MPPRTMPAPQNEPVESRISRLETALADLAEDVRQMTVVWRESVKDLGVQIGRVDAKLSDRGRSGVHLAVAVASPLLVVMLAVGSAAFTPIYLAGAHRDGAIAEVTKDLGAHGHPELAERVDFLLWEWKLRRRAEVTGTTPGVEP